MQRSIRVRVFDSLDPHTVIITGKRPVEALTKLIMAGTRGVTSAGDFRAGVRVSDSIFKLRRAGIPIETETEPNADGDGSHARYRLIHRVEVVDDDHRTGAPQASIAMPVNPSAPTVSA